MMHRRDDLVSQSMFVSVLVMLISEDANFFKNDLCGSYIKHLVVMNVQLLYVFKKSLKSRLDDTYNTYFIICWKNVLIRVFYFWSKIKYITYVIRHENVINYSI